MERTDTDVVLSLIGMSSSNSRISRPGPDAVPLEDPDEELQFIRSQTERKNIERGRVLDQKLSKSKRGSASGGGFQVMGLHPKLLRSLLTHGFKVPTPIQRLAIPVAVSLTPRDLVGMARTGSGKTLAYLVPLINRLGGIHNPSFGARGLIVIPTRDLAVQVAKVGKDLSRGWTKGSMSESNPHAGETLAASDLRWSLVVGGESLDGQFSAISNNPDVIVATPGRLLHLVVEMNLDLRTVQFVVFDEADRLFELGFATVLQEIMLRLPPSRQTLLFSATLPENLVEFAQAGLQDPKLIRLDSETKLSPDLRMAFFSVKEAEKEACLLDLLRNVIRIPLAKDRPEPQQEVKGRQSSPKKMAASPHQTIIFTATKHHVEYLSTLLRATGYAVAFVYGSLDQAARRQQMACFLAGTTDILVVTDVAARGLDIPVLENVINYDFPPSCKVFVHRVGRTARAGRPGWTWAFMTYSELPHFLDLQLFLDRPMKSTVDKETGDEGFICNLILGTFSRDNIDEQMDYLRVLGETNSELSAQKQVMLRGHKLFEKTREKASQPSYRKAKDMMKTEEWGLAGSPGEGTCIHPILIRRGAVASNNMDQAGFDNLPIKRLEMLRKVGAFQPQETVLELGSRGNNGQGYLVMKNRRQTLEKIRSSRKSIDAANGTKAVEGQMDVDAQSDTGDVTSASEEPKADLGGTAHVVRTSGSRYQDPQFYLSYEKANAHTAKGYSIQEGDSLSANARNAALNLGDDENQKSGRRRVWDRSKKRFVGDGDGADNVKLIRTENGVKLPATYRSGRFDDWKKRMRVKLPRAGETELARRTDANKPGERYYRHTKTLTPKQLDPTQLGYDRKKRQTRAAGQSVSRVTETSRVKDELKRADVIRKTRHAKDKKRARNGRQPKKGGRRGAA